MAKELALMLVVILSCANALEDKRVNASDVINEIDVNISDGNRILIENCIIKGDLDLTKLNNNSTIEQYGMYGKSGIKRTIPSEIAIVDSKIEGNLNANDISFDKPVYLFNTTFTGAATFDNSEFKEGVDLSFSTFKDAASFIGSSFYGIFPSTFTCKNTSFRSVTFEESTFDCPEVDFTRCSFDSADFSSTEFLGSDADFTESNFRGCTDFSQSKFHKCAKFGKSKFMKDATFHDSWFFDQTNFADCVFEGLGDYSYARFNKSANFDNAQFKNLAFFRNCEFKGDAKFDRCRFIGDAFFDDSKFDQALSLEQTRYGKIYIRWNDIMDKLKYNDEAYLSLIKNYKDLGWFEDANDCYYKYRCEYSRVNYNLNLPSASELNGGPIRYLFLWYYLLIHFLLWIPDSLYMSISGYGVNPFRPLLWMIAVIPLFGFFYWRVDGVPFWSAIKFSTIIFLSGTGKLFVQAPEYKPNPKNSHRTASFLTVMFYLERIMGMIIFVSFLVAFGKAVLR